MSAVPVTPSSAPRTRRPVVVAAILLALFMAAMEATVVATAMPTVVGDLGGIQLYGWVAAAYMLASTVSIPLYGKLADLHGRKPIMLVGLGLFLLGSMASGTSRSMVQLIAFRGVQGLGAGALQPIALTIVGDLFAPEERARIQGVFGAVWGVAGMIGPLLGGLIVHVLSWRWVFYINVPFGLLSALILVSALHERVARKEHVLDLPGAALLAGAVVSLLLGTGGIAPMITAPLSMALLVLFVLVERRAKEPIVPLAVMRMPVIAVSSALGALLGSVMMATLIFIPLFVQAVLHGTPTEAGSSVAPMLLGWPLASAISGRLIAKVGYRKLVVSGAAVVVLAALSLFLVLGPSANVWGLRGAAAALGVGMGLGNTALIIAVQTSVAWDQRGVATASTMFFRTIGGAVSVGALGSVLVAALPASIPRSVVNQLIGPEHGRGLDADTLARLADAVSAGLHVVFLVVALMAGAALAVSLLFPKTPPRANDAHGSQTPA